MHSIAWGSVGYWFLETFLKGVTVLPELRHEVIGRHANVCTA